MIDFDKPVYVKMGHRVIFGFNDTYGKYYYKGKLKGADSGIVRWDRNGICENGDEDYQLTNAVETFKTSSQ